MSWIDIPPKGTLAAKLDHMYLDTAIKLADYASMYGITYCNKYLIKELANHDANMIYGFEVFDDILVDLIREANTNETLGEIFNTLSGALTLDTSKDWSSIKTFTDLAADAALTSELLANDRITDMFVQIDDCAVSFAKNVSNLKSINRALYIISTNDKGLAQFKTGRSTNSSRFSSTASILSNVFISYVKSYSEYYPATLTLNQVLDKANRYDSTTSISTYSKGTTQYINDFMLSGNIISSSASYYGYCYYYEL